MERRAKKNRESKQRRTIPKPGPCSRKERGNPEALTSFVKGDPSRRSCMKGKRDIEEEEKRGKLAVKNIWATFTRKGPNRR